MNRWTSKWSCTLHMDFIKILPIVRWSVQGNNALSFHIFFGLICFYIFLLSFFLSFPPFFLLSFFLSFFFFLLLFPFTLSPLFCFISPPSFGTVHFSLYLPPPTTIILSFPPALPPPPSLTSSPPPQPLSSSSLLSQKSDVERQPASAPAHETGGEIPVVLLGHHYPRLSQHVRAHIRTLQSTRVARRVPR